MRFQVLAASVAALCLTGPALAQNTDRTIEEIKTETLARAETGAYPTLGIAPDDARAALALIGTRDPAEWAGGWGLSYSAQWPAPTSAGKLSAYRKAVDAYLMHAKSFDPPLEVVRIPFGE